MNRMIAVSAWVCLFVPCLTLHSQVTIPKTTTQPKIDGTANEKCWEADTRQINLTRFSIKLSEKRNFFLDGASIFNFGLENGKQTEAPSGKLNPFFSEE